ncbi:unnamed protein product [Prorocentrum cordatum]|uniref:Uncharacterized protein n=1 Tax=Prorocentrum cordatum TaxID=2364126 RepID=A0ABN9T9A7_9DINO|nr:unnamed protein product [Polarella glacialis]
MPITRFFGGSFPPELGVRLRGEKPLTAAMTGLPRPSEAVGGTATPVPEEENEPADAPLPLLSGHAWVLESTAPSAIGSEVDICKAPLVVASESAGLVLQEGSHARAIRLPVGDVPTYVDSRATELRRRPGTGHEDAEGDLCKRLGRLPLSPSGEQPRAEEAHSPIRSRGVRLLAVGFDGQDERFKPWRETVHEDTQEGIVAAHANPQRVQWEVAKYYTGVQSAEGVASPVLRAHGARRMRGERDGQQALYALPDDMQADAQRRVRELADSWAASFTLDLVSLPGSVRGCLLITDVAPSEVVGFLGDYHERMLAPPVDVYETVPYFDPELRFNQKEYHPRAEEAHSPIRSKGVRLLAVGFDGQDERFKPWRETVHEDTQEGFRDQPKVNLGGPIALEELLKRLAGIVAAHANPQRVQWEVAKYYTGVQSAEAEAG